MLLTEWNWDDALRVRREDGIKEGMQQMLELWKKGVSLDEAEKMFSKKTISFAYSC
jgi:prolyl oligopeptidase PreP (S9A serine peptidase family)